ncbi:hypothetical protein BDV12DRAFT_174445 [Aspergillus spectabilis]
MWKELAKFTRSTATTTARLPAQRLSPTHPFLRHFTTTPHHHTKPQDEEDHFHDRNKLDPSRTENSQSATTDEVAQHDTAFDPSNTAPESEIGQSKKETKRKGEKRDPLTVSGADKDVGGARDPMEGETRNKEKEGASIRGSARKNRERK